MSYCAVSQSYYGDHTSSDLSGGSPRRQPAVVLFWAVEPRMWRLHVLPHSGFNF